jgi:WD40 repeat protein
MFRTFATICLAVLTQTASAEPTSMLVFAGPPSGWIKEYDLQGVFVRDLLEPREFASPQYGAIGPDGLLYVSSWTTHRVVKMDLQGNILGEVVPNDGVVLGKTFLTIRGDELIVSGSQNGAIGVYDVSTGDYRRNLVEEGVINAAHTVLWLDSGDMLVTDISDHSIRRFDSEGSYLGYFSDDAILAQPAGMEISPDGSTLLVSNFTNGQINMFDLVTGDYLGQLFQAGTAADDLTYGPDGMLYAASYGTNSIYRYDFDTGVAEVFIDGTSGLRGPNSVLFVPSPGVIMGFVVPGVFLTRRRRG